MDVTWSTDAWNDYLRWQAEDRKTLKRINQLIKDVQRNGVAHGIGKPEALSGELAGLWSRRIDEKNRLLYHVVDGRLAIVSCRAHYGDH